MAVVRITDTLTQQVLANANGLFAKRLDAAAKLDMPYSPLELYDMMFGEWKAHMLALPPEIMARETGFMVEKVNNVIINYKVVLPTAMPVPDRVPQTAYIATPSYFGGRYTLTGSKWDALYEVALVRERHTVALTEEVKQFKEGVTTILKRFSTLAPALKAWPALWDLLPEDTKTKHKQVVDRKKPELAASDINTDKLTTAVVMSKLTR